MCGIAGVVGPSGTTAELLATLADSLRHRGPDDEGYVVQEAGGSFVCLRGEDTVAEFAGLAHWRTGAGRRYTAGLCHRRLSILDLSGAGHQPMISSDGQLGLVFNGEIYNYLELADELESLGHRLKPCGDTAVLLAAFSEWGPACVHRLRGMWSFAVLDRRSGRLTLSRDRFGIKPLYYTFRDASLVFSSEIKGLLPALPGAPKGATREIVQLLAWGSLDDDQATLFEGIHALPPGSTLHVETRGLTHRLERYYDVAEASADAFDGSLDEAVQEYRRRLEDSVRLHMRSDVEVGSCLSGGIDSNLTAALAAPQAAGHLATFTAVYDDAALDERSYVDLHVAQSGRLRPHFVAPTADGLLAEIDRLVWAQDQPMASSSPFAQWSVMQLAARHRIKVLLDGQGADEVIGGYSYFAGVYLLELARRGNFVGAMRAGRRLGDRRGISIRREVSRAAYHRLPGPVRAPIRRLTRAGYQLVAPEYRELAHNRRQLVRRTFRDHSVDAVRHSLPELLRYEDRSSMAFSIESRVPFLDHPLVELVLSLPTAFKIHEGWSKFVQRRAAENVLPAEIVWRRDKLGFTTPQGHWRRSLAAPLTDYLRRTDLPAFLDRRRLERLASSQTNAHVAESEFWKTVFMLKWIDAFQVRV